MILRFRTADSDGPHYLALNTDTQAYTQGAAAMAADFEIADISQAAYSYILDEIAFNEWSYTDNIYTEPDLSEVPEF